MSGNVKAEQYQEEKRLRQVVEREWKVLQRTDRTDVASRRSCVRVLDAIDDFFRNFEKLHNYVDGNSSKVVLPRKFLDEILLKIVQELGPGDTLIRTSWFPTLRYTAKSYAVRELVLNFLPCVLPLKPDEMIRAELLDIFKHVIEVDCTAIPQSLQSLSQLSRIDKFEEHEIFQFCISKVLSKTPEKFIHYVIQSMLQHMSDDVDSQRIAIDTIRGEAYSTEKAQMPETTQNVCSIADVLLKAFQKHECIHELFFQGYLAELEQESKAHDVVLAQNCEDEDSRYTCLDLLVLLMHRDHKDHRAQVKCILESWLSSNLLGKRQLDTFVNIITLTAAPDCDGMVSFKLRDFVIKANTWLLSFLLLYPVVRPQEDFRRMLVKIKAFIINMLSRTRQPIKEKIISALISTVQELKCIAQDKNPFRRVASSANGCIKPRGTCKFETANQMESFVFDVLTSLARKSPGDIYRHMETFLQVLQREDIPSDILQNVCKLVAYIDRYIRASRKGHNHNDTLLLIRRLLFSRSNEFVSRGSNGGKQIEMTIRGLTLATEIILSCQPESFLLCLLWTSVRMIIINTAKHLVHPSVGVHTLRVVRALHARTLQGNNYAGKELFEAITKALSSSRLVQYAEVVNLQSQKFKTIAYSDCPSCFFDFQSKQTKGHIMSFNFDAVARTQQFMNPANWKETAVWVFGLVDTYLTLGRHAPKRKWIPHSWVKAHLEFPFLDLSRLRATTERQQKSVGQIHQLFNNYGVEHEALCIKSIKEFFDCMRSLKKTQDRSEMTVSMLRCTLSLTLGLSMSVAVLKNTYGRYESALNDSKLCGMSLVKRTATGLVQFQLNKVFDLIKKCKAAESLLRSAVSTRGVQRRGGSRPKRWKRRSPSSLLGNKNVHDDVRIAVEQLSSILSFFKMSDEHIRFKALWICLVDPIHDGIIINTIQNYISIATSIPGAMDAKLESIINLKSGTIGYLVEYLQRLIDQRSAAGVSHTPGVVENELAQIRPYFAQCLRLAVHISLKLPSLENNQNASRLVAELTSLTSAYFRLLALTMQVILGLTGEGSMNYSDILLLFQSILDSDKPLTDAIALDGIEVNDAKEALSARKIAIFDSVLQHLRLCKDPRVATELLECVSIFALCSVDERSLAKVLQISWAALHTNFPSSQSNSVVVLPYSFVEAIKRLSPLSLHGSENMSQRAVIIRETVVKVALSKSKSMEGHFFLLWGLLRHWGFLVLTGGASSLLVDHLYQLSLHLNDFLNGVQESEVQRVKSRRKDDMSEEEEYLPRNRIVQHSVSVYPESTIPCLDSGSFAVYYEIILDMIVAATALFEAQEGAERIDVSFGPFKNLCSLAENFGLMISLYEVRIQAFPFSMISSAAHASRQMLNAVSHQALQCAEWRSSQPPPTPENIASNTFDPASVRFIREMLETFESHVTGRLSSLCDKIDSLTSKDSRREGSQKISLFGSNQKQKTRILRQKIEKARSDFVSLAVAHKIPAPQEKLNTIRRNEEGGHSQPSRKRKRVEIKSLLQLEHPANPGSQKLEDFGIQAHRKETDIQPKWKPKILQLAYGQGTASGDDSSEASWEEGSDVTDESSEDSFEVSGNW